MPFEVEIIGNQGFSRLIKGGVVDKDGPEDSLFRIEAVRHALLQGHVGLLHRAHCTAKNRVQSENGEDGNRTEPQAQRFLRSAPERPLTTDECN